MSLNTTSPEISQTGLGVSGNATNSSFYDLHGICQFSPSANSSSVTTPSSSIPWVLQYFTAVAIFIILLILRSVLNCLNAGGPKAERTPKRSDSNIVWSVIWKWSQEACVFVLSIFSLVINFVIPYFFWWQDTKLNHGWCGLQTMEQVRWLWADCSVSATLLLLWVYKVGQMWSISRRAVSSGSEPKQSRKLRMRAVLSSVLRDWECFANVANFPLIWWEITAIICVYGSCGEIYNHWKVRATSLQFLRLFCLTWLSDKILRLFPTMAVATETVIRRIVWIACSFVCFAAWIQLVETLGDPWLSTYNGQKELTYWKVVTFLYGKLVFLDVTSTQLETTAAKISVYVAQAIALIFLIQIIPEMFKQLPGILRIRSFPRTYSKEDKEFVLILGSVNAKPVHRFVENLRLLHPEKDVVVMLEPDSSDTLTEQMHTVAGRHKGYLTVLSASVFKEEDMLSNSVISTKCGCAFFFANDKAHSSEDEDHCNFLRVHALKQCYPKTRVIVQVLLFENKERFCHIPNWRKHNEYHHDGALLMQADRVVCTAEIQFALLGQHYFAPGISNIVTNWYNREKLQQGGETIRAISVLSAPGSDLTVVPPSVANPAPGAGPHSSEGSSADAASRQAQSATRQNVHESFENGVPNNIPIAGPSRETGRNTGINSRQETVQLPRTCTESSSGIELPTIRSSSGANGLPASSVVVERPNSYNDEDHDAEDHDRLLPSVAGNTATGASPQAAHSWSNDTTRTGTENCRGQQIPQHTFVPMTLAESRRPRGCLTYEKAREAFGKCDKDALLLAVLQNGVFHIYPRSNLVLTSGARLFFITSVSAKELIKQVMDKEGNSALAGVQLDTTMHNDVAKVTKRRKIKIRSQLQSTSQNSRIVCDSSGQYQRYLSPKLLDVKDKIRKLQHHVVVCVLSDRNPASIGLLNLIKPLRAVQLASRPPVVILARPDSIDAESPALAEFPEVYFVKGNPMHNSDLDAVNAQECRMCIVVDASERPKDQLEKWEQQVLSNAGYWPILPKHFYRHVNTILAAVSISKYLDSSNRGTANMPEEILICIHHKAVKLVSWNKKTAGTSKKPFITADTVTPGFTDALMLTCYEDKDVFDLLRLLILGGYREGFKAAKDQSSHGSAFVGNQAKVHKMKLAIANNNQGSFVPLPTTRNEAVDSQASRSRGSVQSTANRDAGAINGYINDTITDLQILRSLAAASGYLVIGSEKSCQTPNCLTDYEYLVLERPCFVQARHKLIDEIRKAIPEPILSLNYFPDFILKTIEEGRSGYPDYLQLYHRADWLYAYYGIVVAVIVNQQNVIEENIRAVLNQHLAVEQDSSNQQPVLPRLPMAILTYVKGLDTKKQEDNFPSINQVIPVEKFFYDLAVPVPVSLSVGRKIEWNELQNKDWDKLTYPDPQRP